jgi:HAE1 family hydrophobic/amphiphilic exporter-1
MRPVLMTQVATIMGMVPVTLSSSDGAEFRAPMGVLVIGGLLSSTVLTLVVVPAAYSLMGQGLGRISTWRNAIFPKDTSHTPLTPPAPALGED